MPLISIRGPTGSAVSYRIDRDVVTIGRSISNDLVVPDPALSRVHAEVRRSGDGWVLIDHGSRNGTRLNGRPVTRSEPLADGDEIHLGGAIVVFGGEAEGTLPGAPVGESDRPTWSVRGGSAGEGETLLVGRSPAIRDLLSMIDRMAASNATVLITGENGTGKELIARLIHIRSPRAAGPFVVVNCPALPGSLLESELFGVEKGVATGVDPRPGRFEIARGGTLLLDEIGDMDGAAQAKILRVLQEKKVERIGAREPVAIDVRILAATNHDLESEVAAGRFRRDLFHRLKVLTVALPPLRERREDIPLLVEHFVSRAEGPGERIDPEALATLERYDFPGNVRELEHIIERARFLAKGPSIALDDLPPEVLRREGARPAGAVTPVHGESREGIDAAAASVASDPSERGSRAEHGLYERLVSGEESFWDAVHAPFLRREISREAVRDLVARGWRESGGSYKRMARLFHIEAEHKRLLNFLRNHHLGVDRR